MKTLLSISLIFMFACFGINDAEAILAFSSNGQFVNVDTLANAATRIDLINKNIVVDTPLNAVQSNISSATVHGWPTDRSLEIKKGGSIGNTTTFRINGSFKAGIYQVFTGTGFISFNSSSTDYIQAEWFGNIGDNSTDNTTARNYFMQSLMYSNGVKGLYGPGVFLSDGWAMNLLTNPWSISISGMSPTATTIKLKNTANKDLFAVNVGQTNPNFWPSYWTFSNLVLDGNNANNTTGSVLNLYQCNLFRFDNVILQNGAEWNLKVVKSIGVHQFGATNIWSNNPTSSVGTGSVYIKDSSDVIFDSIAVQGYSGSTQQPIKIEKSVSGTNNTKINSLYMETSFNGIKIVDSAGINTFGFDVQINPTILNGTGDPTGVLFDISGNKDTRVKVQGGVVANYHTVVKNIPTTSNPLVSFIDVDGISNTGLIYQQDQAGYTSSWGMSNRNNLIWNGDFELWGPTVANSPWQNLEMSFDIASGALYGPDYVNFRSGTHGWMCDNTSASSYSRTFYTFNTDKLNKIRGNILNGSVWVKANAASAVDLYIDVIAASLGGEVTYVSDRNYTTSWERLRQAIYIPLDATSVSVVVRSYAPYIVTVDQLFAALNYVGPFSPSPEEATAAPSILYGVGFPIMGVFAAGVRVVNVTPAVGSPKAWINTTAGAAYMTTRGNSTPYNKGQWLLWPTGTTVWECTTAGTTASSAPSITGLVVGSTVTDGSVTWTMRSLTKAVFTSEGNL